MLWVLVVIVVLIVLSKLATRRKMQNTQTVPTETSTISQLKTGDVLLFMSGDSPDVENLVLNSLIYTHIAIVYEMDGEPYVVEVMPCKQGVVLTRARQLIDSYCGTVLVCHIQSQFERRISQKIKQVVGALGGSRDRTLLEVLGVGLDSLMCVGSFRHDKIQWCSSLVYHILSESGVVPRIENGHCITPDELIKFFRHHGSPRLLKKLPLNDTCSDDRPLLEVCGVRLI